MESNDQPPALIIHEGDFEAKVKSSQTLHEALTETELIGEGTSSKVYKVRLKKGRFREKRFGFHNDRVSSN